MKQTIRGQMREARYEHKRLEFVQVRKSGGGEREKFRRRIGGFHTLHKKIK
jgi:hypothetical protein